MKSQGLFHLEFCFSCRLRPLSMPLHLWLHHCASDYSTLRLLLCERLHISSSASVSYATPNFFCFSFCRRQSWLILLDLLWGKLSTDIVNGSIKSQMNGQYYGSWTHVFTVGKMILRMDHNGFSPKTRFSLAASSLAVATLVVPIFFPTWPTRMRTVTEAHQIVIWFLSACGWILTVKSLWNGTPLVHFTFQCLRYLKVLNLWTDFLEEICLTNMYALYKLADADACWI